MSNSPPCRQTFVRPPFTSPNPAIPAQNFPFQRKVFPGFSQAQTNFGSNIRQTYAQMRGYSEPASTPSFNKEKAMVAQGSTRSLPPVSSGSAAGAVLANSVQQQRLLQANSGAAPYLLQTIRNSYERSFAAMNWLKQFSQPSMNNNNGFPENLMDFK